MGNEIVVKDDVKYLESWGIFAGKAGLIPAGTTVYQAMAIIQNGKEIGLQPLQSLRSMSFIKGRLAMSVQLQLALAKAKGVKIKLLEDAEHACTVILERNGEEISCTYTLNDAKKAGLVKPDGNYEKYERQMLRWRAIGDCLRIIAPDTTMNLLSPEEADAIEPFHAEAIPDMPTIPSAPTPNAVQYEANKIITGVAKITSTKVKSKTGREFDTFRIYGKDNISYSTTKVEFANLAKTAEEAGLEVAITTKGDKYNTIINLDVVEPPKNSNVSNFVTEMEAENAKP